MGAPESGLFWISARLKRNRKTGHSTWVTTMTKVRTNQMKSILENPLILKYFGHDGHTGACLVNECELALRVIQAMEEPIKPGERYLYNNIEIYEYSNKNNSDIDGFHWSCLRLPSRFQPAPKATECPDIHAGRIIDYCGHHKCTYAIEWSCGRKFNNHKPPEAPKCDGTYCERPAERCSATPKPPATDKVESKRLEMMDRYLKWQKRGGITSEDAQFGYDLEQLIALVRAEKGGV